MRSFPSVTEVMQPWVNFSRVPPRLLEAAAEICAAYAQGIPVIGLGLDDERKGYFDSFRRWFDAFVDEVILSEERLFDEQIGFSGEPDLVVRVKKTVGGSVDLIDLKTPLGLSKSWRVQLAGYQHLCEVKGIHIDRAGSLRLDPYGKVPKIDWYGGSVNQDFFIFMSCLNAHHFFQQ